MSSFGNDRVVSGWDYSGPPHPSEDRSALTTLLIVVVGLGLLVGVPMLLAATGVISAAGGCGGG